MSENEDLEEVEEDVAEDDDPSTNGEKRSVILVRSHAARDIKTKVLISPQPFPQSLDDRQQQLIKCSHPQFIASVKLDPVQSTCLMLFEVNLQMGLCSQRGALVFALSHNCS